MIRPFTLVCMLMAGGSGLYLYQSKHRAQMLDREIGKTIKQTEQTRERIGMLKAEWALLNEPERLAELSKAHLGLRTLQPTQFVAVADLAARLPAPIAPNAPKGPVELELEPEETPAAALVAQTAPPSAKTAAARPAPVAVASASASASVADPKPATESKPAKSAGEAKPAQPHQRPAASVQMAAAPRPTILAPVTPIGVSSAATAPGTVGEAVLRAMRANAPTYPARAQPVAASQPAYVQPAYAPVASAPVYAGSLLGSARGSLPPPVPYSAR